MATRYKRLWQAAGLLAIMMVPLACQDALNPDFLALMGEISSALPEPGSSVVLLFINETVFPARIDYTPVPRAGAGGTWTLTIGSPRSYIPRVFECGVSQITIEGGEVLVNGTWETANFPGGPLDEGVDYVCGAVIKIYIYPWQDDAGNPIWEIASETVLD